MTVKHTPGPWTFESGKSFRGMTTKFLIGDNGQGFAHTVGLNEPEDTANAHLMISAPDMLAALEDIVKCESNRRKDLKTLSQKPGSLYEFSDLRVKKAEAAINKAKGN